MRIRRFEHAENFAERVRPWLLEREAENHLMLGLLSSLASGSFLEQPPYLACIEMDGAVAGCALRTPPHKLLLTRLPHVAVALVVNDVAGISRALPAVMGREEEVTRFAELWSRRTGCAWSLGTHQRVHALSAVTFPGFSPRGQLRPAASEDLPLLVEWLAAFARDTGVKEFEPQSAAEMMLREHSLHLWQDGQPRSMAAARGPTPHGIRVAYVYTPPALRGRGYASITVATLSDRLLHEGHGRCFLYTDLANPTSNHIYARIGYRPVCDIVDADFEETPPPEAA